MMKRHEMVTKNKTEEVTDHSKLRFPIWPERFCVTAVWIIFTTILWVLAIISVFLTCSVYGGEEVVQYKRDFVIFHLLCWYIVTGAVTFLISKGGGAYRRRKAPSGGKMAFLVFLLFCSFWVLSTLFWPGSDQRMVYESAMALVNGDYSSWAPVGYGYSSASGITGYAFTYPAQNGLILFFALIAFVFRSATPIVVQFLNILFFAAGVFYVHRLFQGVFPEEKLRTAKVLMLAFLPFVFYITFVYGTVSGFAFASAALYYEHRFLKTGSWKNFFLAAAGICIAILLKSNYLIVLVTMLIYLLTGAVFQRRLRLLGAAMILVLLYIGSGRAVNFYLETVTGAPVSKGIPMLAWVEMGLQEGSRAPGWYNGYNVSVFKENESDSELAQAAVKKDLEETLNDFAKDPKRAADFLLAKTASIWAEPTFQSLWIQEVKGESWLMPGFTDSLFKEGGILNRIYVSFFNFVQSLVYMGTLMFFILNRKRLTWEQMMPAVLFIGGFLFHLAWEAKGQYSVCYFILLIPYAVMGVEMAAKKRAARRMEKLKIEAW